MDNYDKLEGVRISHLAEILKSPVHYQYAATNSTDKPAYHFGRFFHTLVLETSLVGDRYVLMDISKRADPETTMSSKANKAWKAEFEADASGQGKEVIEKTDYDLCVAMRKAIMRTPAARELISLPGTFEDFRQWEVDGVKCKGKRDRFIHVGETILDLKTANDASTEAFTREAFRYQYHTKGAWYLDGFKAKRFVWLVVEKKPPHAVNIFTADNDLLAYGRAKYELAIKSLKICREHYGHESGGNRWPSYNFNEMSWPELTLPRWIKNS